MNTHLLAQLHSVFQSELQRRRTLKTQYDWKIQVRPEQLIPEGNWRIWMIMAGRGFGKTRTGAETIRHWVDSGQYRRIALIGDNILNAQQVMIEGISGLLKCYPPGEAPIYERRANNDYCGRMGRLLSYMQQRLTRIYEDRNLMRHGLMKWQNFVTLNWYGIN